MLTLTLEQKVRTLGVKPTAWQCPRVYSGDAYLNSKVSMLEIMPFIANGPQFALHGLGLIQPGWRSCGFSKRFRMTTTGFNSVTVKTTTERVDGDKAMLKQNISTFLRSIATGMICVLANVVSSQEPVEAPFSAANGFEEVAATVFQELQLDDLGVETLTRGPLHEAFAEPIVSDPIPGLIVNREPPADINEMAPEFRPEGPDGDEAIWISGYWGWDEQREDFIWVSGVYRIPPDGLQWVPGYWYSVSNGWQWVQGLWVDDVAETIMYLPPPPASLENGPSSPSPGVEYFYIPGNWSQASSLDYAWSTGYWHPLQADLIWVPAHTVWTPRGCIFINGYWDRRLPSRGLCFAPVVIPQATYSRPGWSWRPNVVLNAQVVLHNLFVQPGYNHYLFGDYYGLPLGNRNVVPAYMYHQRRGSFDPLISFYSAYNARQGQDMMRWYGNHYADLNRNPDKRPPQQWSPNLSHANDNSSHSKNESPRIAQTLDQLGKMDGGPRISPISANIMQDLLKHDGDRKKLAKDRVAIEGKAGVLGSTANAGFVPPTMTLPKLEKLNRKTESSSRVGKMPEQPRNLNRDRVNPSDLSNKLQGNLNTRQGTTASPNMRRIEANGIPNRLDSNRIPENLKPKDAFKTQGGNPQSPKLNRNTPVPSQNDLQPQAGRIQSLEQRGLDALKRNNQPGRLETNDIPNRLGPARNPENAKPKDTIKNQGGNFQPPQPNRISPAPDSRPANNRDLGIQGNLQDEIKNKFRGQQQPQKSDPQLGQPKSSGPILQGNAPLPNSIRKPEPDRQPRQEKQSKGDGNDDKKDKGKKPK